MKKIVNSRFLSLFTIVLFLVLIYFFVDIFGLYKFKNVEAVSEMDFEQSLLKNKNPVNINKILKENTKDNIKEEMILEEIDLEYTTTYIDNEKLPVGTIHVTQLGEDGRQDVITIKSYNNDELISEEIVASNIKRAAINKIVEIGTGSGKNNYELQAEDTVYTTAASLQVRKEANKDSDKITTLSKGTSVYIIDVFDNGWSYILTSDETRGYVLSEALSNINPNKIEDFLENTNEYTKEELLATLNKNMDVSVPSGFSLEQFRKVLQYNENDKNSIFTNNCDYFYYAEQEYGINGIFLASIAIHESGWGTSKIALEKNNLFGYMAYDNNSYVSSKEFSSYSEGIDLLARVLIKYYLNPSGTEVYGGNIAEGKYYSGNTIKDVNKYYATDSNWSSSVYSTMESLYKNL